MAENSNIEWCSHTVNLFWGCSKVHTGCKNCYAEFLSDKRYKNNLWGENAFRKRIKSAFPDLDKYQKQAQAVGEKHKVFIGSMMDIFEDSKPLVGEDYETEILQMQLFDKIDEGKYPNLIFLFLTKRPQNISFMIPNNWLDNPPQNVWFGTSISNQATADEYIPKLIENGNFNYFLSIEPQVGIIQTIDLHKIKWVIQGGESGVNKRPFQTNWIPPIMNACKRAEVPYFFKQIDKVLPIPEIYFIREFPNF